MWAGADDLAWGSKAWRVQLSVLRGKVSLWEGGLFGRLMLSPEAVAVLRPGSERVRQGVDAVSGLFSSASLALSFRAGVSPTN